MTTLYLALSRYARAHTHTHTHTHILRHTSSFYTSFKKEKG